MILLLPVIILMTTMPLIVLLVDLLPETAMVFGEWFPALPAMNLEMMDPMIMCCRTCTHLLDQYLSKEITVAVAMAVAVIVSVSV